MTLNFTKYCAVVLLLAGWACGDEDSSPSVDGPVTASDTTASPETKIATLCEGSPETVMVTYTSWDCANCYRVLSTMKSKKVPVYLIFDDSRTRKKEAEVIAEKYNANAFIDGDLYDWLNEENDISGQFTGIFYLKNAEISIAEKMRDFDPSIIE